MNTNTDVMHNSDDEGLGDTRGRFRMFISHVKANKKKYFTYWIIYQAIKGTLTTSFIWIPLLYIWFGAE